MSSPVLVVGDTLVDCYPDDRLALGEDAVSLYPGGSGANAAIGLARLYGPPRFHTALASDRFADLLAQNLRDEGLDDGLFRRVDGETSVSFLDREAGEVAWYIYHRPATLGVDADAVPDSALSAVDRLQLTGITLGEPDARAATLELARRADDAGLTVAFDLNGRANMWDGPADYRAAVESLLPHVDVAFASEADLGVAGVAGDPTAHADWLHDRGVDTAFVTLGPDGALASDGVRTVRHGGFDVDAVNPAGAGDAFAAAVVGAYEAADLGTLLALGNAAGAVAATADSPTAPLSADRVRALLDGEALAAFERVRE